jgi:hypothetical protein
MGADQTALNMKDEYTKISDETKAELLVWSKKIRNEEKESDRL